MSDVTESTTTTTVTDPAPIAPAVTPVATPAVTPTPTPPVVPVAPKEAVVDVQKLLQSPAIQEQLRLAAEAAFKKGQDAAKEEADKAAARAKLEETDRLRLEKQEADEKTAAAERTLNDTKVKLGVARALADASVQLEKPAESRDFIEYKVEAYLKQNPTTSPEAAAQVILAEHPYLIKKAGVPAEAPVVPTTIVAPTSVVTTTNTTPAPITVDVLSMSKAEYDAYKRKQHGMG